MLGTHSWNLSSSAIQFDWTILFSWFSKIYDTRDIWQAAKSLSLDSRARLGYQSDLVDKVTSARASLLFSTCASWSLCFVCERSLPSHPVLNKSNVLALWICACPVLLRYRSVWHLNSLVDWQCPTMTQLYQYELELQFQRVGRGTGIQARCRHKKVHRTWLIIEPFRLELDTSYYAAVFETDWTSNGQVSGNRKRPHSVDFKSRTASPEEDMLGKIFRWVLGIPDVCIHLVRCLWSEKKPKLQVHQSNLGISSSSWTPQHACFLAESL